MARAKYYYNAKTLRYERARPSVSGVLSTIIGLLCFGAVFFVGLFYLQNKLIDTPAERELRAENAALKKHHNVLSAKLESSKNNLGSLLNQEDDLHKTFFDSSPEKTATVSSVNNILIGDEILFNKTVGELTSKYESSILKAAVSNDHYSRYASVSRYDLQQIQNFPGKLPVPDADVKMLVSGYGTRINPWHKGKYHHDGIDFAGVRGSDVLSTGDGVVILVKKSDLPAGFGNYIEIDHGFGYVTRYTHLGEIRVRLGEKVKKGKTIAIMGMSGGSIAPHVHYEVLKDGHQIDPMKVLVEGVGADQFNLMAKAASKPNQSLD
ncbi:MAG TPA: M23 family metallopeptidase [Cyclobacteriaceae bacterium]|nr:M23 family metallopeptidase [Cyclobacteriaceae bacterium]